MNARLFVCTDHDGHWPVGVASVVIASDEAEARSLLDAELVSHGLKPHALEPYGLRELSLRDRKAFVLLDGDY